MMNKKNLSEKNGRISLLNIWKDFSKILISNYPISSNARQIIPVDYLKKNIFLKNLNDKNLMRFSSTLMNKTNNFMLLDKRESIKKSKFASKKYKNKYSNL